MSKSLVNKYINDGFAILDPALNEHEIKIVG